MERRIWVRSLKRIRDYLLEQKEPVYISKICEKVSLDTKTIRKALEYLDYSIEDKKIKLNSKEIRL